MENKTLLVNNHDLLIKEINGERVVTFRDVDEIHERPEGTAKRNFNANKEHFLEGEDYRRLSAYEIRTQNIMCIDDRQTQDIVFLTEMGYLMLVKSLNDKLAWQVQRQLVRGYFRNNKQMSLSSIQPQIESLQDQISELNKAFESVLTVDYKDTVQNELWHINEAIEELRKGLKKQQKQSNLSNKTKQCQVPLTKLEGKALIQSVITPLAIARHDKTLNYNSTYRIVYNAMGINWKEKEKQYYKTYGYSRIQSKTVFLIKDKKLMDLFIATVQKLLESYKN